MREPPAANGENCVIMLSKLCPLRPGAYHVGVTKVRLHAANSSTDLSNTTFLTDQQLMCQAMPFFFFVLFQRQLFLKEDVYQLLECKRERTRHLAALTLQRYTRMFFVRKRFLAFRKKIIGLQARCRGYLARSACSRFEKFQFSGVYVKKVWCLQWIKTRETLKHWWTLDQCTGWCFLGLLPQLQGWNSSCVKPFWTFRWSLQNDH